MTTIARTVIKGFTCEIEPNEDREGVNCYVSKGSYSASLACLEGEGCLEGPQGMLDVEQGTIDLIAQWAQSKGY